MAESDHPLIAVVVALKEEARALGEAVAALPVEQRRLVRIVRGGVGPASAAKAARSVMNLPSLKLMASSGFAGGLDDTAAAGELILVEQTMARKTIEETVAHPPHAADPDALKAAWSALKDGTPRCHRGRLVTIVQAVFKPEDKRRLGQLAEAIAVDMEAAAVARVAAEKNQGFFALKAISDAVDDALPEAVGTFLDEDGNVRMGQIVKFAVAPPTNIAELMRLKRRSDAAEKALRAGWAALLPPLIRALEAR